MQPYKAALVKTTGAGENMQIFVRPGQRTLTLDVRPSDAVAVVKRMIHVRTYERSLSQDAAVVPASTIKLVYGGRVLDDEQPLSHYGVADNATIAFDFNRDPKTSSSEEKLLYVKYPADKKAFTSDCIYAIKPTHTVADLRRMILEKEGIVVGGKVYDGHRIICDGTTPPPRLHLRDGATLDEVLEANLWGPGPGSYRVPTVYVPHFSWPARASRNVTRLATDLLREVLLYSELRTLAASTSTCRALLEAVPPKLAHELVLRKFPILSTVVDVAKPMPPARELFESQARLFAPAQTPIVAPSRGLDEYVFSLELTVGSSKHVGTGVALDDAAEARICFTGIPKALWGDATKRTLRRDRRTRIRANIMVTRRGTLRRAALYSGRYEHLSAPHSIYFESNRIPSKCSMEWISAANGDDNNVYYKPLIFPEWDAPATQGPDAGTCELIAKFMWDSDDSADAMDLEDACLMLEHWCKL